MNITVDKGLKEYRLTDNLAIHFNPTDEGTLEKIYTIIDTMYETQDKYEKALASNPAPAEVFEIFKTQDAELRALLDGAFDVPLTDEIYGDVRLSARASSGLPLWFDFLLQVLDIFAEEMGGLADVNKRANAKVDKYVKKWQKKAYK